MFFPISVLLLLPLGLISGGIPPNVRKSIDNQLEFCIGLIHSKSPESQELYLKLLFNDLMKYSEDFRYWYRLKLDDLLPETVNFVQQLRLGLTADSQFTDAQLQRLFQEIYRKTTSPFAQFNPEEVFAIQRDLENQNIEQFVHKGMTDNGKPRPPQKYEQIIDTLVGAFGRARQGENLDADYVARIQANFVLFVCPRYGQIYSGMCVTKLKGNAA